MRRALILLCLFILCAFLGHFFKNKLKPDPIVATLIKERKSVILNPNYHFSSGVASHELIHLLVEDKILAFDVPYAAAFGYYVTYTGHEKFLDNNIESIIKSIISRFSEQKRNLQKQEKIFNEITGILSNYKLTACESHASYLDGGKLAGLTIALFDTSVNAGTRFIISLAAGSSNILALHAANNPSLYTSLIAIRNSDEIHLRESYLQDLTHSDFINNYFKHATENSIPFDSLIVSKAISFCTTKQTTRSLQIIDSIGSKTIIVTNNQLGRGLKKWSSKFKRNYIINTAPPFGINKPVEPLFIMELINRIFNLEKIISDSVYNFTLRIKNIDRNILQPGSIIIEWSYAIDYEAVTTLLLDESDQIEGALIRFHPSLYHIGLMSQEIMHSLGMINHLYEAWAQHKYAMADPYPLGDTTWNQSFLALPEVTKNIKLSHYLMNLGAVKDARDVLISISLDSLTSSNQLLELVEAYTRSNQENFALDILREGISRFPLDFNIQKKLIYTLNLNQNYREADSLYQVWSISSAFVKQFRKDYDFQISRINTYLFLGDTSRAFRDALNLVNRKPNDPALHLLLAQLYILRSRKNYALKHIQRALSIDSTSLRTTYAVSMAYLQLGMYDLAQKWINVAASQDPTIVDRLHGLGLIE